MEDDTPITIQGVQIDTSVIPAIQPSPKNRFNLVKSLTTLSSLGTPLESQVVVQDAPIRVESVVPIIKIPSEQFERPSSIIRPLSRSDSKSESELDKELVTTEHEAPLTEEEIIQLNVARGHKRAQLLNTIEEIKRDYPNMMINPPSPNSSLEEIDGFVNGSLNIIESSHGININRLLLIVSWGVIELIGRSFGLDITGFAKSQFNSMKKYNTLLLRLGNKKAFTTNSGIIAELPPEVKLLFMSFVSGIAFIGVKYLSRFMGFDNASGLADKILNYISGEDDGIVTRDTGLQTIPQTQQTSQQHAGQPQDFLTNMISSFISSGGGGSGGNNMIGNLMNMFMGNGNNGGNNNDGINPSQPPRRPFNE